MTDSGDYPFRFSCQRSGNCCARPQGVVRVTPEDVARMAAHLGMEERAFRSRYVASSGDRLRAGAGPSCVFLDDGPSASCSIYAARPAQCRSWPFWQELRDPTVLEQAMRFCPGIRR